uniref:hypothetical protein n=1 Tax=Pantoea sp. IMH TaxID=1267600 RepID=UPI00046AB832|nr:hypothetical protein [Pantoea sp. IMH]
MRWLLLLLLLSGVATCSQGSTISWPDALAGIAAGEHAWLNKTPELASAADVQQAQALESALSSALSTNTEGTLKALTVLDAGEWPHFVGSDIVCMGPVNKQAADIETFYQQTRLALLSTEKGAVCLWILEATYEEWKAAHRRKVDGF